MSFRFAPLKRYCFCAALFAAPLLAAEEGAEGSGIMIWKVLNFLILAGLLGYLLVKNLGPALVANRKAIAEGLEAGEKAKKEAEARAAAVQAKLANLEQEIAAMRTDARAECDREADRIRRDAQAEMARIRTQAEAELDSAVKQARLELRRYAAKLALDLAEQKVRARMSLHAQAMLVTGFLAGLHDTASAAHAA
jgi:F-type H+-transporting ATPase subunit b